VPRLPLVNPSRSAAEVSACQTGSPRTNTPILLIVSKRGRSREFRAKVPGHRDGLGSTVFSTHFEPEVNPRNPRLPRPAHVVKRSDVIRGNLDCRLRLRGNRSHPSGPGVVVIVLFQGGIRRRPIN